ncbi:dipeptide/oligopeptide/nickel ABC transporter ATP-binding protein [Pleomorphomonas sp. JP5]|uniref:ATP-binding cassette domain-containing protein n=1 Tax=Pleomorphomonas sp. JP5 TaxID=2942998 RepID=UPI002042D911|nr:dipeptide/oligopeptide/nickel ABC transporter ATP-binding protein [Pleomorphomonas sp. JP5]MCM5558519.1 dipeptide/oligopeptide/nickel ABC transporter ATP-binding protein [Pleomorphomonas sp. JP5]
MTAPLLVAHDLSRAFTSGRRRVAALDGVSLSIAPGETLGLVGGSGCGKSTLARVLTRLVPPESGSIAFMGDDWLALSGGRLRAARRHLQMVFQDPLAAFNPRATVGGVIADALRIHAVVPREKRRAEVGQLIERVGLPSGLEERSIRDISGGQRQRVAIARAIAVQPRLIVLDEAASALDVSVRGRILELLVDVQRETGVAYLFISHDLAVIRAVSHRIAVMAAGRIVEEGPAAAVIAAPASDTLRELIGAVPALKGNPQA